MAPSRHAKLNQELQKVKTLEELAEFVRENALQFNEVNAFTATTQAHRLFRYRKEQQQPLQQHQSQPHSAPPATATHSTQHNHRSLTSPPSPPSTIHMQPMTGMIASSSQRGAGGYGDSNALEGHLLMQLVAVAAQHLPNFDARLCVAVLTSHAWMWQLTGCRHSKRGRFVGQQQAAIQSGMSGKSSTDRGEVSLVGLTLDMPIGTLDKPMRPLDVYHSTEWKQLLQGLCDRLAVLHQDVRPADLSRAVWSCAKLGYTHDALVAVASQAVVTAATARAGMAVVEPVPHGGSSSSNSSNGAQLDSSHSHDGIAMSAAGTDLPMQQHGRTSMQSSSGLHAHASDIYSSRAAAQQPFPPQSPSSPLGSPSPRDLLHSAFMLWSLEHAKHTREGADSATDTNSSRNHNQTHNSILRQGQNLDEQRSQLTLQLLTEMGRDKGALLPHLNTQEVSSLLLGIVNHLRQLQLQLQAKTDTHQQQQQWQRLAALLPDAATAVCVWVARTIKEGVASGTFATLAWSLSHFCRFAVVEMGRAQGGEQFRGGRMRLLKELVSAFRFISSVGGRMMEAAGGGGVRVKSRDVVQLVGGVALMGQICEEMSERASERSGDAGADLLASSSSHLSQLCDDPGVRHLTQLSMSHATQYAHTYTSHDVCEMAFALATLTPQTSTDSTTNSQSVATGSGSYAAAATALSMAAARHASVMPPESLTTLVWSLARGGVVPRGAMGVLEERVRLAAVEVGMQGPLAPADKNSTQQTMIVNMQRCDLAEDVTPSHVSKVAWALAKCSQLDPTTTTTWPELMRHLGDAAALHAPDMDNRALTLTLRSLSILDIPCLELIETATKRITHPESSTPSPTRHPNAPVPLPPSSRTRTRISVSNRHSPAVTTAAPATSQPSTAEATHNSSSRDSPQPASQKRNGLQTGPSFTPLSAQQLSMCVWSSSKVLSGTHAVLSRSMAPLQLLQRAAPVLARRVEELDGQGMAMVAAAYLSAQVHPSDTLLAALTQAVVNRTNQLAPHALSVLARVISHYKACDQRFLTFLADHIVMHATHLPPMASSNGHTAFSSITQIAMASNNIVDRSGFNSISNAGSRKDPVPSVSSPYISTAPDQQTTTTNQHSIPTTFPAPAHSQSLSPPHPQLNSPAHPATTPHTITPAPLSQAPAPSNVTHSAAASHSHASPTSQTHTTPTPATNTPGPAHLPSAVLPKPVRHAGLHDSQQQQQQAILHNSQQQQQEPMPHPTSSLPVVNGAQLPTHPLGPTLDTHVGTLDMQVALQQSLPHTQMPIHHQEVNRHVQGRADAQQSQGMNSSGSRNISERLALKAQDVTKGDAMRLEVVIGMAVTLGRAKTRHAALLDLAVQMMYDVPPNQAVHGARMAQHAVCLIWAMAAVGHSTTSNTIQHLINYVVRALASPALQQTTDNCSTTQPTTSTLSVAEAVGTAVQTGGTRQFDVRLLAMLVQALPALRYQPSAGLLDAISYQLQGRLARLSTHTLCEMFWAFASLQYELPSSLFNDLVSKVEQRVMTSRQELLTLASSVKLAWAMAYFRQSRHPLSSHALANVLGSPPDACLTRPRLLRMIIEAKLLLEVEGRSGGYWRGLSRRWDARVHSGAPENIPVSLSGQGYGSAIHAHLSRAIRDVPTALIALGYQGATWKATPQGELACCFTATHLPRTLQPHMQSSPPPHSMADRLSHMHEARDAFGAASVSPALEVQPAFTGSQASRHALRESRVVELPEGPCAAGKAAQASQHPKMRMKNTAARNGVMFPCSVAVVILCPWHLSVNDCVDDERGALGSGGDECDLTVAARYKGVGVGATTAVNEGGRRVMLCDAKVHVRLLRRRGLRVVTVTLEEIQGAMGTKEGEGLQQLLAARIDSVLSERSDKQ